MPEHKPVCNLAGTVSIVGEARLTATCGNVQQKHNNSIKVIANRPAVYVWWWSYFQKSGCGLNAPQIVTTKYFIRG